MYLYSKAITIASEKDCFQKEQEKAKGTVPLRSVPVGPCACISTRSPWHTAGGWSE